MVFDLAHTYGNQLGAFVLFVAVGWRQARAGEESERLPRHLVDRNYSLRTIRTYGCGTATFCRWLETSGRGLDGLSVDGILAFRIAYRTEQIRVRPGLNAVNLQGRPTDRLLFPASIYL